MKNIFLFILIGFFCIAKANKTTVIFRYDDPSPVSSTQLESKILEEFHKRDLEVVFGVIPVRSEEFKDNKIQLFKKFIKNGTLTIAQHGYKHTQSTYSLIPSEFNGMAYSDQIKKIKYGKVLLESLFNTEILMFIPPFNRYDKITEHALEDLNFSSISSYIGQQSFRKKLYKIPCSCNLDQFNIAYKISKYFKNTTIVIMFHPSDIENDNGSINATNFKKFTNVLDSVKQNCNAISFYKAIENKIITEQDISKIHTFYPSFILMPILNSSNKLIIFTYALYFLVFLIFVLIVNLILSKLIKKNIITIISLILSTLLFIIVFYIAYKDLAIDYRAGIVLLLIFANGIGSILALKTNSDNTKTQF